MKYISEPSLNSELILINNRKKLEEDPSLYNDEYLEEIEELRKKFEELDQEPGNQIEKRRIRNRIRDLSSKTYVYRDKNIFGEMIILLLDKLLTRPNFSSYNFKNDMKMLAIEHILKYTWRFDSYRQSEITGQYISAFTYITTIAFNAFVATINKFNREKEKSEELFVNTAKEVGSGYSGNSDNNPNIGSISFSNNSFDKEGINPSKKVRNESRYEEEQHNLRQEKSRKKVVLNNIKSGSSNDYQLLELIKKIEPDEDNIIVEYNPDYKISLEEYQEILNYTNSLPNSFVIKKIRNPKNTKKVK